MKNYYQILKLQPDDSEAQIKKQYRMLLRAWQPEKFTDAEEIRLAEENTRLINEAYDTLSDPIRREAYDQAYRTYGDEPGVTSTESIPGEEILAAGSQTQTSSSRNTSRVILSVAVAGVILVAGLAYLLVNQSQANPEGFDQATPTPAASATPDNAGTLQTATAEPTVAGEPTTVPTVAFTASDPATCQPATIVPEVSLESEALYPSSSAGDWTLGPENAPITIYEYSDFQCPYCAKAAPALKQLHEAYPKAVRIVFRHFPLSSIHPNAVLAAQAAEAAGLQNKFWQMHDLLFDKQSEWSGMTTEDFQAWLKEKAKSLNLNSNQFMLDLVSESVTQKVSQSESDALAIGLNATPTLLFNKIRYQGRTDLESLTSIVEYFQLPEKSSSACPAMTIDPDKNYRATIKTEKGDIVIQLYPRQAPMAVNSFVSLARSNWFDGSAFFRVIPGFVAQAGDPSNSGLGGPGYAFTNEVTPELRFDKAGVVGMANTGNNDNGSQFFITYAAVPDLDGKYTVFGQVIEGMDVLAMLRPRNPSSDQILITPDAILSITIEEN